MGMGASGRKLNERETRDCEVIGTGRNYYYYEKN